MGEPFDTTREVRGGTAHEALVRYVETTDTKNETDWLEWKTDLDLASASHRFEVAKHILGFSNRHPDRAAHHAGGLGLLVLGAEPGNITGQTAFDNADFTNAMRGYLGARPAWSPSWVHVDGKNVLVITVEAPRWGDPIHPIRRGNDKHLAGAVFVRGHGLSQQASAEEVDMLTDRARRGASDVSGIEVLVVGEPLVPLICATDDVETWLDKERERLLAPLVSEEEEQAGSVRRPMTGLEAAVAMGVVRQAEAVMKMAEISGQLGRLVKETRSPEEYREAVDAHIEDCREILPLLVAGKHVSEADRPLRLVLQNLTASNIAGVRLTVHLEGAVQSFEYEPPEVDLPTPPGPWGPVRAAPYLASFRPLEYDLPRLEIPPGYTSQDGGSTTIEFDAVHLSPRRKVPLPAVLILVEQQTAIRGHWEITSTDHDGVLSGNLSIPVSAAAGFNDLIASLEESD